MIGKISTKKQKPAINCRIILMFRITLLLLRNQYRNNKNKPTNENKSTLQGINGIIVPGGFR